VRSGVSGLSEREREVLRLLARGHDAKSSAAALGTSIHSVNERLRDARQKLGVSSSREAARILAASEESGDKNLGAEKIGVGTPPGISAHSDGHRRSNQRSRLQIMGGLAVLTFLGVLALSMLGQGEGGNQSHGAAPAPQVVVTSPSTGAVIRPGPIVISVTFDRPMRAESYSFVQASAETYPQCEAKPTLSADRRTYSLRCTVQPARRYELWFNRRPFLNFKTDGGVAAAPYRLRFTTRR
jgi:DNA-binding CsgD family transcriptional regulator